MDEPKKPSAKLKLVPPALFRILIGAAAVGLLYGGQLVYSRISDGPENTNFVAYSNETLGVDIKRPEGWEVQEITENPDSPGVSFTRPTDEDLAADKQSTARMIVGVQKKSDAGKVDADSYFESIEEANKNLGKPEEASPSQEYAKLTDSKEINVGNLRALRTTLDIVNYKGQQGRSGRAILVFVFISPTEQASILYEGNDPADPIYDNFEEVIDSFNVKS